MTSWPSRARSGRVAGFAAAVALVAASVLVVADSAAAHDELLSTDPPGGATVDELPEQITLTFSAKVVTELGGNDVQVTDASGAALADGDPVITDNVVTQPLTAGGTGAISVAWRVVSEDGHPVSGQFSFTVADRAPTPAPTPTTSTGTSTGTDPSATSQATPEPSATPVAAASPANPLPWIVLGVVLIAAVAGVVYLLVSRGRQRPGSPAGPTPDR